MAKGEGEEEGERMTPGIQMCSQDTPRNEVCLQEWEDEGHWNKRDHLQTVVLSLSLSRSEETSERPNEKRRNATFALQAKVEYMY